MFTLFTVLVYLISMKTFASLLSEYFDINQIIGQLKHWPEVRDHQSYKGSSSGDHKCLHKLSCQPIHRLSRLTTLAWLKIKKISKAWHLRSWNKIRSFLAFLVDTFFKQVIKYKVCWLISVAWQIYLGTCVNWSEMPHLCSSICSCNLINSKSSHRLRLNDEGHIEICNLFPFIIKGKKS